MKQLTKLQLDFLEKSVKGTWNQDSFGYIDVKGYVDCSNQNLNFIPVQFGKAKDFWCNNNQLTSLKGCPSDVTDFFYAHNNQLTSLEFCPSKILADFSCDWNNITSIEFCPSKILGDLTCSSNPVWLETLEMLFKTRIKYKLNWEQALEKCWKKIPIEDKLILDLPESIKQKYRGSMAAENLGLI